jgi:hypothetical protein
MEENDVDDRPTPIVKFAQAHEFAQLLSNFAMEHSSVADAMNMQPYIN